MKENFLKKNDVSTAIEAALDSFFLIQKDISKVAGIYVATIREVERIIIRKVLQVTGRNKKMTAQILGISRNTLDTKIKNFNLK